MARDDKIQMPSSGAGITRYFGDYKTKLQIAPGHVRVIGVVIALIVLALHQFGSAIFI